MFDKFFRLAAIIGALPINLQNGTTADATQVMSDLNWIVNQVNANAASLTNTALKNANNNFTVVQSGIFATAAANFPIVAQVPFLISSKVANMSSSLVFDNLTGYQSYELVFLGVVPQTNGAELRLRLGPTSASIDPTGTYSGTSLAINAVAPVSFTPQTSNFHVSLARNVGGGSIVNGGVNGRIGIYPLGSDLFTNCSGVLCYSDPTNSVAAQSMVNGGRRATVIDGAVQLSASSGAIASGTVYLYGLGASL